MRTLRSSLNARYVRGFRLGIVSCAPCSADFNQGNTEVLIYPPDTLFPIRQPSLCKLTGKGLLPLSSLSFSSSIVSTERRRLSRADWSVLPQPNSRHQQTLKKPDELFTRRAMCGFGLSPVGGFEINFDFAPALTVTALGISTESLSRSPAFARKLRDAGMG